MERITIDSLIEYVDGEVTQNRARQIEQQLDTDPIARQNLQKLLEIRRGLKNALQSSSNSHIKSAVFDRLQAVDRGHGLKPIPRRAALSLAAIGFVCLLIVIIKPNANNTFTPRGSTDDRDTLVRKVGIQAYLHTKSDPFTRRLVTDDSIFKPDDGFSFVLINRSGRSAYLLLFAVDAQNRIHWFYPAMTKQKPLPVSVTIPATPQLFPLPDGVTPENIAAGTLRLVAFFSDRPQRASVVENRIVRDGIEELHRSFPKASIQILSMRTQKEAIP